MADKDAVDARSITLMLILLMMLPMLLSLRHDMRRCYALDAIDVDYYFFYVALYAMRSMRGAMLPLCAAMMMLICYC